jgi:hypothetical protein
METDTIARPVEVHCSFCRKGQADVECLVAGFGVSICSECIDVAAEAREKSRPIPKKVHFDPVEHARKFETEQLLKAVAQVEPVYRDVAASQALYVDILRERGVSWADIGASLGVSRQAAWKRFAQGPETE